MTQNDCESLQWSFWDIFWANFGPWRFQKSQILSAVIRTGHRPPKLTRCITWLTTFVKKKSQDPPFKGTVTKSGWKTHHFGTTLKGGNFFHLALLRHQNIKTTLNFLEENHWARPFFALFSSVREKLQLTVSLNHPVDDIKIVQPRIASGPQNIHCSKTQDFKVKVLQ